MHRAINDVMMMEALDQALLDDYDRLIDLGSHYDPISIFLSLDWEEVGEKGGEVREERGDEREEEGGVESNGNERTNVDVGEGVVHSTDVSLEVVAAVEAIVAEVVAAAVMSVEMGVNQHETNNNNNNVTNNNNNNVTNTTTAASNNNNQPPSTMSTTTHNSPQGAISMLWANHCALWFHVISSDLLSTRASGTKTRASGLESRAGRPSLINNHNNNNSNDLNHTTTEVAALVYHKVQAIVQLYPELVYEARDKYHRRTLDVATPAMKRCIYSGR